MRYNRPQADAIDEVYGAVGKIADVQAVDALAVLFVGGVVRYALIEVWSFLDSAYMVVLTFTTVVYEDVNSSAG